MIEAVESSEPQHGLPGETRSVPLSILWAILTLGIYTFFWTYRTYEEMRSYAGKGLGGGLGLAIYLVMLFTWFAVVVTGVLIWSELKEIHENDGRESPHTPLWGLWLLLPIIGSLIWFIPTQNALNDFWMSKGAPPPP